MYAHVRHTPRGCLLLPLPAYTNDAPNEGHPELQEGYTLVAAPRFRAPGYFKFHAPLRRGFVLLCEEVLGSFSRLPVYFCVYLYSCFVSDRAPVKKTNTPLFVGQDGLVRWEDFERLTGGVREAVRGDAAKRLERRCVWETTCPETGMPNAYVVSAVKEKGNAGWGRGRRDDADEDEDARR